MGARRNIIVSGDIPEEKKTTPEPEQKKKISRPRRRKTTVRGKKYKKSSLLVNKNKEYPIPEAIKLVKEMAYENFDATIELHRPPLAPTVIGKVSSENQEIEENYKTAIKSADLNTVKKVVVTSTMGPGVRVST